jgi:hypothetical protein
MGWFTGPHQMWSATSGSRTTNLSPGERPVWGAVTATKAPPSASIPSRRRRACSTSSGTVRFQYTAPWVGKGSGEGWASASFMATSYRLPQDAQSDCGAALCPRLFGTGFRKPAYHTRDGRPQPVEPMMEGVETGGGGP